MNTEISMATPITLWSTMENTTTNGSLSDNATMKEEHKFVSDPSIVLLRQVCEVWITMPIAVFGLIGNLLSFIVLSNHKHKFTTNIILRALTIADSLVLIFSLLLRTFRYIGIPNYDSVYNYIFYLCYPALFTIRLIDTWFTVLLTVDRYIAVCHPLHAQRLNTRRRTYLLIIAIVILSLLFSIPRHFEYKLVDRHVSKYGFSTTSLLDSKVYAILYRIIIFFLLMYIIPMALLIVLNSLLLCTLYGTNNYRAIKLQHQCSTVSRDNSASNRNITIIVVIIVTVCVICNLAAMTSHILYSIHNAYNYLAHLEEARRYASNLSNVAVTLNSSVNFIIYCVCSKNFRTVLIRLICCQGHKDRRGIFRNQSTFRTNSTAMSVSLFRGSIRRSTSSCAEMAVLSVNHQK